MNIQLTDDEALVLYDLLHEYSEQDNERQLTVHHAAQRNALWALQAALEKQLVAPFESDYAEQLQAAQVRVEQQEGGW